MYKPLQGKVAIVTGAAQSIGREVARLMAARGATVVVADVDGPGAERSAEEIRGEGVAVSAVSFDLTREEAIAEAVATVVARHGGIDIIHNNAAIQSEAQRGKDLDVVRLEASAWDIAMDVNARGPMLLCKHAIPHMITRGGGSIIHSASGFGLLGETTLTAYGASKAALINLSRFIATQYGKLGIRSNAIAIGFVLTDTAVATTPQAVKDILLSHHLNPELGRPQDIAQVVAFLASDEAKFINGAMIPVDGGFTAHQASMADFQRLFAEAGSNQL
jgi:NAD(P)-dependent dehydrogenase (short-subunit alcohol dehydrogenase family)